MRNGLLFLFVTVLAVSCLADTLIVDLSGAGDYLTIQSAIDAAQDGDTVLVRDGVYAGDGNRDIICEGKLITIKSENGPHKCIIDCQGTEQNPHRGFTISRSLGKCVINGFMIMNGYGPADVFSVTSKKTSSGGGILCHTGSSPIILNCVFYKNSARYGGAVKSYKSSNPFISNCQFIENVAVMDGGGFHNSFYGRPILNGCTFQQNKAEHHGGGMYLSQVYLSQSDYDVDHNITNCLIVGNFAGAGGGVYIHSSETSYLNCTIVENRALWNGGGVYIGTHQHNSFVNCILWNNVGYGTDYENPQIFLGVGRPSLQLSYCCIQNIESDGFNINGNPMFRYLGYWDDNDTPEDISDDIWVSGDYHLLSSSPCIDTGHPSYVPTEYEIDLDGNPRVSGDAIDMGVYEFINMPPVADAANITAYAYIDGYMLVSLDGEGSYDVDGDVLEYYWYNDANELIATGAEPNVVFGVGEYVIDLIVNDGIEDSEPDSCVVMVIEAIEVDAKLTPQALNRKSNRPHVIGRLELVGLTEADIDPNEPMVLMPGDIAAQRVEVLPGKNGADSITLMGFFDHAAVMEAIDNNPVPQTPSPLRGTPPWQRESFGPFEVGEIEVTIAAKLLTGQWVYGRDTVTVK